MSDFDLSARELAKKYYALGRADVGDEYDESAMASRFEAIWRRNGRFPEDDV